MQVKETKFCTSATRSIDPRLWVVRYADYLYSFAVRRLNNQDQAKDLVQDTFLSGLENMNDLLRIGTSLFVAKSIFKIFSKAQNMFNFYSE